MKSILNILIIVASLFAITACTDYPEELGADGEWDNDIEFSPQITDNLSYESTFTTTFDIYQASKGIESGGFRIDDDIIEGRVSRSGNHVTITATCPKLRFGNSYRIAPFVVSDGIRLFYQRYNWFEYQNSNPDFGIDYWYRLNANSLDVYIPVKSGNVSTSQLYVYLQEWYDVTVKKPGVLCIMLSDGYSKYYIKATFENGEFPRHIRYVNCEYNYEGYRYGHKSYVDWSI